MGSLALLLMVVGAETHHHVFLEHLADSCRFAEALEVAETLVPPIHEPREAALVKARLLIQLDRQAEAEKLLLSWIETGTPEDRADVQLLVALARSQLPGRAKDARVALARARKLGADKLLLLGAEAMLEASLGELTKAETLLRLALREEATLSGAIYNLGCIRARQGHLAEAAALVRQAWYLGWRNVALLRRDPWLAPLRQSSELIADLLATKDSESRCPGW